MDHHIRTIVIAAAIGAIAFIAGLATAPRQAAAPGTEALPSGAGLPAGAFVIPMDIVSIHEQASTSPTVMIEYPRFPTLSADLNSQIASTTLNGLADFRRMVAENDAARRATGRGYPPAPLSSMSDYSFLASWQPVQANSRYVSFIERYDSFSGGANENQTLQTFNYDVQAKKVIGLDDLLKSYLDYLSKISSIARERLDASLSVASDGHVPTQMIAAGTAPDPANFQYFTFTDSAITFYFPKYAVAPGVFGEQHVTIPFSDIK
ncbi:DUF3298 domain-containing protein [Patescibacteria group bacterium]|nr:DUF3298 domain-containing protein [Patescibacteria group bacterium]MDE1940965.1 DUF3298 domain-containing protein [Patescibacteria group bacterium]